MEVFFVTLSIQRLDSVLIPTKHLVRSAEWYVKNLGLDLIRIDETTASLKLKTGNPFITLFVSNQHSITKEPTSWPIVIFYSEHLQKSHQFLKSKKVEVSDISSIGFQNIFTFHDDAGNKIGICSHD